MRFRYLFAAALATPLISACSGPVEDTLPGQPIKHRQEAFKEILRSFEPMGTMLRTNRYEAEPFIEMTTRFISRRDGPWDHFIDGSFQPPTRAREAVWSQAEDFEKARVAFMAASEALYQAAHTQALPDVRSAYANVESTCRSCHEVFRN